MARSEVLLKDHDDSRQLHGIVAGADLKEDSVPGNLILAATASSAS